MRSLPRFTLAAALIAAAAISPALADVGCGGTAAVRVGVAPPPPLPETDQPPMPAYGYQWTPGSWSWNPDINDYYWTPGAWVMPPAIGLFWTPGFWGWDSGVYVYHAGYWGPHVGFYGGIRYGFGYWGHGYDGGYWRGRTFYYNRAYNNIGRLHINALYDHRVAEDRLGGRTSFNGGPGGVVAVERADERLADRDNHIAATVEQARHFRSAAGDASLRASVNHGHPLATAAAGAVAAHAVANHMASVHAAGPRAAPSHGPIHVPAGHPAVSHATHFAPAHRSAPAFEPRHDGFYSHYTPPRNHGPAPGFGGPPRGQPQPFHAESPHWSQPRPGPAHAEAPRGGPGERPHP